MSVAVVVAVITSLSAVSVAGITGMFAYRAQRATAAIQAQQKAAEARTKQAEQDREDARHRAEVEAAAYERARLSYERIVADLNTQIERNQRTFERVSENLDRLVIQLAAEQDVSNQLRARIQAMAAQIDQLRDENARLHDSVEQHSREAQRLRAELAAALAANTPPPAAA